MTELKPNFQAGDRVSWNSIKMNSEGGRYRTGTIIKIYELKSFRFWAVVKPDYKNGGSRKTSHIYCARLTLLERKNEKSAE